MSVDVTDGIYFSLSRQIRGFPELARAGPVGDSGPGPRGHVLAGRTDQQTRLCL